MKITAASFLLFLPFINAAGNLPECDAYRDNLKAKINGWRKNDITTGNLAHFICESSFRVNLREEIKKGEAGTPMLSVETKPRCDGKFIGEDGKEKLCRDTFTTKDECNSKDECIFDEPQCIGEGYCKTALSPYPSDLTNPDTTTAEVDEWDRKALNNCTNAGEDCHYEPAPRTNVCITKDLNGNFFSNKEERNLLETTFRDPDNCTAVVEGELEANNRRKLNDKDFVVSPLLDYIAIILDANNWEGPFDDNNADKLNTQFNQKKKTIQSWYDMGWYDDVVGIRGEVQSADDTSISGWSCDIKYPHSRDVVTICFGTPFALFDGKCRKLDTVQPSGDDIKRKCGGKGNNHRFEFKIDDRARNDVKSGDGKVYVYGQCSESFWIERLFRWRLIGIWRVENHINSRSKSIGVNIDSIEEELSELEEKMSDLAHDSE